MVEADSEARRGSCLTRAFNSASRGCESYVADRAGAVLSVDCLGSRVRSRSESSKSSSLTQSPELAVPLVRSRSLYRLVRLAAREVVSDTKSGVAVNLVSAGLVVSFVLKLNMYGDGALGENVGVSSNEELSRREFSLPDGPPEHLMPSPFSLALA